MRIVHDECARDASTVGQLDDGVVFSPAPQGGPYCIALRSLLGGFRRVADLATGLEEEYPVKALAYLVDAEVHIKV